jgi:nucleotide-binding universal stress UspA family protein
MMTSDKQFLDIHRILVALDASPQSLAALEVAAEIAERFQAELIGIHVEDTNLLRLAEYPFACEVGHHSATLRELQVPLIEFELRARSKSVERAMSLLSKKTRLRWSLRIARGVIPEQLIAAAQESDLIILGKTGWSRRRQLGSTARVLAMQPPPRVFILQRSHPARFPVLLAYDGSSASKRAIDTLGIIKSEQNQLMILLLAKNRDSMHRLKSEVQPLIEGIGMQVEYRWMPKIDTQLIPLLVRMRRVNLLILPANSPYLPTDTLLALLNESDCSVLLVQ